MFVCLVVELELETRPSRELDTSDTSTGLSVRLLSLSAALVLRLSVFNTEANTYRMKALDTCK